MHAGKKADVLVYYAWSFIAKTSVLPERPPSGMFLLEPVAT